jgi:hypothetical protein
MSSTHPEHLPYPIRSLFEEVRRVGRALLAFRSFPRSRTEILRAQLARVAELLDGEVPAYYLDRPQRELSSMRVRASGRGGYAPAYAVRGLETAAEQEEFWRQALATEARILEAHYERQGRFPKAALAQAEPLVRRLYDAALSAESFRRPEDERRHIALGAALFVGLGEDSSDWEGEEGDGRARLRRVLAAVSADTLGAMALQDDAVVEQLRSLASRRGAAGADVGGAAGGGSGGAAGAGVGRAAGAGSDGAAGPDSNGAAGEGGAALGSDRSAAEIVAAATRGQVESCILEMLLWRLRHAALRDGYGVLARMIAVLPVAERQELAERFSADLLADGIASDWEAVAVDGGLVHEAATFLLHTSEADLFRRAFLWCAKDRAPHDAAGVLQAREDVALAALEPTDLATLLQHRRLSVRETALGFSGKLGARQDSRTPASAPGDRGDEREPRAPAQGGPTVPPATAAAARGPRR